MRLMLVSALQWLRTHAGRKLHPRVRRRLMTLYRPPRYLPCWFNSLWYRLVERVGRVSVIMRHQGACDRLSASLLHQGCAGLQRLDGVGLVCARVPLRTLHSLCCTEHVSRIWLNGEVRAYLDTAVPAAGALECAARFQGRGVTIAIVDTGIHPHPDLEGRIVGFADMVGRRAKPYDDNGHGTHVSGCAAGSGAKSKGLYRGPAPAAKLVGVKVLNKAGVGQMSTLLKGIDWVIQHKDEYNIRIMSMSLGGEATRQCDDDPLCHAAEAAWEAGIVVVTAAGNDGPDAGTIGTPGTSPKVITVGATDDGATPDRADDQLASFSSHGPAPGGVSKPDLLAPGVAITSLRSPGSLIDKQLPQGRVGNDYMTLSGTSMATPLVSGLVAMLLESEPDLSPDEVKERLLGACDDLGLNREEQGAGYLFADRLFPT